MTEIRSLDEAMSAAAADAVAYAGQQFGIALDYSEESVERVEQLLGKLYDSIPRGFLSKLTKRSPSPKDLERMATMVGAYIGEVVRRNLGGTWKLESSAFPGQQMLTFQTEDGIEMWPQVRVSKRLANGPEDNVWHYFQGLNEYRRSSKQ